MAVAVVESAAGADQERPAYDEGVTRVRVKPRWERRAWGSLAQESVRGGKNPFSHRLRTWTRQRLCGERSRPCRPGSRVRTSSNRMLKQREEHQPPIRSNTYFGVAVLSALADSACARRSRGPFLKELVKRKRFSFGWLRSASARRTFPFDWARGPSDSRLLAVVSFSGFGSVVVASLREVAIVLF